MVRGLLLGGGGQGPLETPPMGGLLCQDMATCSKPRCDGREEPSVHVEARGQDPKSRARGPYNKSNKCEKCDEHFLLKDTLAKHIDSVHTAKISEVGTGFKMTFPSKQLEKLSVAKEVTKEDILSSKTIKENSPREF